MNVSLNSSTKPGHFSWRYSSISRFDNIGKINFQAITKSSTAQHDANRLSPDFHHSLEAGGAGVAHSTPCDDADSINPSWREDSCHFFQSLRQTTAPRFSLFVGQPCLFRSVSASTVPSRTCFRFKNCRFSLSATTALPRTNLGR
jgi:hypothetical protein